MNNNIILLEDKKFINSVYDDSTLLEDINYDKKFTLNVEYTLNINNE